MEASNIHNLNETHPLNDAAARHLKTLRERGEDLAVPALYVIALLHWAVQSSVIHLADSSELGDLERQVADMFHWKPEIVMQYLQVSPEGNETALLESLQAAETPEDAGFEIANVVRCNLALDPYNDQYTNRYKSGY